MLSPIRAFRSREQTAAQLVGAALERIAARAGLGAWTHLDAERALREAAGLDARFAAGQDPGPLAGLVAGVKDNIDVAGMPTGNGLEAVCGTPSPADADAPLVARLRAAGVIVMGKTSLPPAALGVTPGARNPLDPRRTPGSSSSGSAIAVADGQVPLALGTQTNASLIRPASFCGVAAWKPTWRAPAAGMTRACPSLDVIGVITASLADMALLPEAGLRPPGDAPIPAFAWALPPGLPRSGAACESLRDLADRLGAPEIRLPEAAGRAQDWLGTIMDAEMAANLGWLRPREAELPRPLRTALEHGRSVEPEALAAARKGAAALAGQLDVLLRPYAALLTLAAPDVAPFLEEGAGSPLCSTVWSLAGLPCVTFPAFSHAGLPIGLQLTGPRGSDAAVWEAGVWLEARDGYGRL